MRFERRFLDTRKQKGVFQDEFAQHFGTKGPLADRYERDEMKPSIEVASNMTELMDVSLDYLIRKTDVLIDDKVLGRIT